jgi:hypothetical protein
LCNEQIKAKMDALVKIVPLNDIHRVVDKFLKG